MKSKRRIPLIALTVAGTFALAAWLPTEINWLLCGAFLAPSLPMVLLRYTRERAATVMLLSCAVAFAAFAAWTGIAWQPLQRYDGQTVAVQATVHTAQRDEAILCIEQGLPQGTLVAVSGLWAERDDAVSGTLVLSSVDAVGLDFHQSRAEGVYLSAQAVGEWTVSGKAAKPWHAVFTQFGDHLQQQLSLLLPHETGDLIGAVCLGHKENLSADTVRDFRAAGLSHMLALSGLHLSLLQSAIYLFLRRLRLSARVCAAVTIVLVWMFVLTVGVSASLLRAAVMTSLALAARLLFLRADALHSLSVALLLILLFNPFAIYDVGLLLSFGATLGILLLYPRWHQGVDAALHGKGQRHFVTRRAVGVLRRLGNGVGLSLSAMAFTLPITLVFFGSVSWITPLSNLLAVPILSAAVSLGFAALPLLAMPLTQYVAPLLLLPAAGLAQAGMQLARLAASARWFSGLSALLFAGLLVGAMWRYWLKKDKKEAQYDTGTTEPTDQERTV